jgi:hypothetical protein
MKETTPSRGRDARLLDGLSALTRVVPDAEVGELVRLLQERGQRVAARRPRSVSGRTGGAERVRVAEVTDTLALTTKGGF